MEPQEDSSCLAATLGDLVSCSRDPPPPVLPPLAVDQGRDDVLL